ncbi:1227_t:CDS:2 [Acaulospora morrowiae]|uniref:1227_t:CDS:1 n=1 Tax=Acaulospora morrowiae TaxID=94023 RepID=A0A9N9H4J9_9GLOM|nr:1227_t:CDS:2 [Acaulospora morrowiae]
MLNDHLDEFLVDPNTTWLTFHENENLPTNIYKDNTLPSNKIQLLLQIYPWNKLIKLDQLPMDKKIGNTCLNMTKKWTKALFRLSYHFLAVIHPIYVTI